VVANVRKGVVIEPRDLDAATVVLAPLHRFPHPPERVATPKTQLSTYLFEQPPFLDNIRNSLLLDASRLVDIFQSIELLRLLVLNDSDLNERSATGWWASLMRGDH